ncbi:hypothetical protein DL95DRAFT_416128 [Leptodontidium sp. 2 PMI_412]|nr:hypothetical protein DL95DRAFT_416128 [Leptodontidium sp. 2 PMI_412]
MEPIITNSLMWELGKRQNGGRFIGYTSSGTDSNHFTAKGIPIACPTLQTVSESGTFFACVVSAPTSTSFGIATTCTRGISPFLQKTRGGMKAVTADTVALEPRSRVGPRTCVRLMNEVGCPCCSNTLNASRGDTAPYHAYACGTCISTLFRDIPSDETTTTNSSIVSSTTSSGSSNPTPTSSNQNGSLYSNGLSSTQTTTTSTPLSAQTSTNPSSSPSRKPASKAWIAGAVVGPIVVVAIISALVFYIWKLKKRGVVERERVVVVGGDAGGKAELDSSAFGDGENGRVGGHANANAVEVQEQGVVEADAGGTRADAVELPGWRGR